MGGGFIGSEIAASRDGWQKSNNDLSRRDDCRVGNSLRYEKSLRHQDYSWRFLKVVWARQVPSSNLGTPTSQDSPPKGVFLFSSCRLGTFPTVQRLMYALPSVLPPHLKSDVFLPLRFRLAANGVRIL